MAARRKPTTEELTLLELSSIKASINNLVKAIDRHSENTGKWLSAVAQAAANPADNTEEIRRKIAEITADVKGEADAFEAAAEEATNTNEGE